MRLSRRAPARPIISGFLLVEFAALVVPAWRSLRNGSASGRRQLVKAAIVVSVLTTAAQAFAVAALLTRSFDAQISTGGTLAAHTAWTIGLLGDKLTVSKETVGPVCPTASTSNRPPITRARYARSPPSKTSPRCRAGPIEREISERLALLSASMRAL